jgi:thiopeptide-type bacteriocin biosynthesis protein
LSSKPVHHGFFVLRSPSLPINALDENLEHSPKGRAEPSYEERMASSRRRLERLAHDPFFREALFLSSRSLWDRLTSYDQTEAARSKKLLNVELSLTRYLLRMAMDCTPFGLSAGHSIGRIARRRNLRLASASDSQLSSRLSASLALQAVHVMKRCSSLRNSDFWRTVSPLSNNGSQLRFYERKWTTKGLVTRLNGVQRTRMIEAVLSYARQPRSYAVIARLLARHRVPVDQARAFVDGLIDIGLLVPACGIKRGARATTTPRGPSSHAHTIRGVSIENLWKDVSEDAQHLDACSPAERLLAYRNILSRMDAIPDLAIPPRPFDVSVRKPGGNLKLDQATVRSALATVAALGPGSRPNASVLNQFASRFVRRFKDAFVPILDVFDTGIGIPWIGEPSSHDYLLDEDANASAAWDRELQKLTSSAKWADLKQIDLPADRNRKRPLDEDCNRSGYILLAVLSDEWRAKEADDSRGVLYGAGGACGAELLSRASLHDPVLRDWANLCAKREENGRTGAIFAEISHVPDGWSADVVERPALRRYGIDCLGSGGSEFPRQIDLGDIHVGVRNSRFVLRSGSLRKWIVPRFTSAYAPSANDLPIFQFLFAVCAQDCEEIRFTWPKSFVCRGYLPRVRINQWIVSRSRWILRSDQRASILNGSSAERYAAVQDLRRELRWSRFVEVVKARSGQFVDLDDPISTGALSAAHWGGDQVALYEVLDDSRFAAARGPEGSFRHEIVLPYQIGLSRRTGQPLRFARERTSRSVPELAPSKIEAHQARPFARNWTHMNIFVGESVLDLLLTRYVQPLVQRLRHGGLIDKWFFVRYADPNSHVRLRLHLPNQGGHQRVASAVSKMVQRAVADRCAWSADWATYEPESCDYGGGRGMALSEGIFCADSEAVIQLLGFANSPQFAARRWLLAVVGMHDMMQAFGLDRRQMNALLEVIVARTPETERPDKHDVSAIYRSCRGEMISLLMEPDKLPPRLQATFRARLEKLSMAFRQLRRAASTAAPLEQILANHLHMFANRLFAQTDGKEEYLAYDLLWRATRQMQIGLRRRPVDIDG